MTTITNADREAAESLANQICGCATRLQSKRDVALVLAYRDQARREALEEAAAMLDELANAAMYEREYIALDGAAKRLRALIGETK